MSILIPIIIVITCLVLAFFVLIQNPKGGGLAGSFSGLGTQMLGAKQSTDAVEKGTWYTAAFLLAVVLLSFSMAPKMGGNASVKTKSEELIKGVQQAPVTPKGNPQPASAPAPAQGTPAPAPSR